MQSKHYTDRKRKPASSFFSSSSSSSSDQPLESSGGKKHDASCCYLQMRDGTAWNNYAGLREETGFSSGSQFLEGMIDAHLRLSILSVLARLRPCSCHKVDAACELPFSSSKPS
ncbi:unnamed protein product [Pleuronectes platessa]|uniref:Uncharacterized protein n=1 Tax=Pleuronectes platessa TaxID=8262 RepID=A0A9N7VT87_PLEPL|nr:unnamed protein product [Pleuronectes platessa]